jgi:hypothetical protein
MDPEVVGETEMDARRKCELAGAVDVKVFP